MAQSEIQPSKVIQEGTLQRVAIDAILPSDNNPRQLFDAAPLEALKESIKVHGVLVPLTIHKKKGSDKYHILDGERRYRCCRELADEGLLQSNTVPANIVDPPDRLASLLYMFSIHNFREGWELMPTALGLKTVMEDLQEEHADNKRLREITGLSEPQIERCRTLLSFPEEFQAMSMEPDTTKRIPSNFWIEAKPVLDSVHENLADIENKYRGRDGLTRRLVEKYQANSIRSVIHFRRVMDALDMGFGANVTVDQDFTDSVSDRVEEWLDQVAYETRAAFDSLIHDNKRVLQAIETCTNFKKDLDKLRLNYEIDRDELRTALEDVRSYVSTLLEVLKGEEIPDSEKGESAP